MTGMEVILSIITIIALISNLICWTLYAKAKKELTETSAQLVKATDRFYEERAKKK